MDHEAEFQKAKAALPPHRKAPIEKTEKVLRTHGARAAVRQTIRNAHEMLNKIEDDINEAGDGAALDAALTTGLHEFESGIAFLKTHKTALLDGGKK